MSSEIPDYNPNLYERARLFIGDMAVAKTFRDEHGRKANIVSRIRVARRFEELRREFGREYNEGENDD